MFKLFLIYPNFQMVSENAQWPPFNFVFFKMLIKHLIRGRIIFRWRVISCSLAIWKQIIVHRMECTNVIYRNIFYCQAFFFFWFILTALYWNYRVHPFHLRPTFCCTDVPPSALWLQWSLCQPITTDAKAITPFFYSSRWWSVTRGMCQQVNSWTLFCSSQLLLLPCFVFSM